MKIKAPAEEMSLLSRVVGVLLILAVLVLVTVFFAVRTDGGGAFVRQRLERHLGFELSVERVRIGWPYALVFDKVASVPGEGGSAFEAGELRVGPSLNGRLTITLRRLRLRLERNRDGVWMPAYFSRLGEVPVGDLSAFGRVVEDLGARTAVDVRDGAIAWGGQGATNVAAMHGIDYRRTPVKLPGRRMLHHDLRVYAFSGPTGDRRDIEKEWLTSEHVAYLDLSLREGKGAGSP